MSVARKHGCIAKSYPIDVTKAEDVFKTFDLSTKCVRYPLRGLVTCAGISGEAPAIEYPEAVVRKIFDINYFGSLFCAQAAARCFQANNVPGSIIFIASMSGSIANKVNWGSSKPSRLLSRSNHPGAANSGIQLVQSGSASTGSKPRSRMGKCNRFSPDSSELIESGAYSDGNHSRRTCTRMGSGVGRRKYAWSNFRDI